MKPDIIMIGGDKRQYYIKNYLKSHGYLVTSFDSYDELSVTENIPGIIITGFPFSKDNHSLFTISESCITIPQFLSWISSENLVIGGNFSKDIISHFKKQQIPYYDLMKTEQVAIANAVLTAEGTIMEAIKHSNQALHGSNCLVLGYGRCGKVLADKLKGLNMDVTICARNPETLAYAKAFGYHTLSLKNLSKEISNYSYIFNTIPAPVLTSSVLKNVNEEVTIIDIASSPGGTDFTITEMYHINAHLCLGIPGKTAPKAAGTILAKQIITYLSENYISIPERR